MNLKKPEDQRFRWKPISWQLSEAASGTFPEEAPFKAAIPLKSAGKQTLRVSYAEEIFDGIGWQTSGQVREVEERSFSVK